MQGFEVTLEDYGQFHIPPAHADDGDRKISFDPELSRRPWIVTEMSAEDCKWIRIESFNSLDDALDWCVSVTTGAAKPQYRVNLPCGGSFSRPGRVKAEDVMSSMGWVYVTHLTGFAHFAPSEPCSETVVRRHFLSIIEESPNVRLGEITPLHEDATLMWIADLHIPFEGFIQRDHIEFEKDIAFSSEGIKLRVQGFDCKVKLGASPRSADLFDFSARRAQKMSAAA